MVGNVVDGEEGRIGGTGGGREGLQEIRRG